MIKIDLLKKQLADLSGKVQIVSFDVFDTLLVRLIPTERVSELAAEKFCSLLSQETPHGLLPEHILKNRFEFQKNMKKTVFGGQEWTLTHWLNDLAEQFDLNSQLANRLGRQSELEAESISLRLDDNAGEAVALAKTFGMSVIVISDMWLDQEWLGDLLETFGLFFDKVFTSGSLGASKRNGTAFKLIAKNLHLKSEAFIHVGNKFKADFFMPRLSGWNSIWMPRIRPNVKMNMAPKLRVGPFRSRPYEDILQALEIPSPPEQSDPYFKLAYNYMAPLLIIFSIVQWRLFRNQGIQAAFYIARDARMMFEVYNLIADHLPSSCPRYYLYLSRKAVALIHPDNFFQNVTHLAGKVGKKSLSEWLSNFSIDPEFKNRLLEKSGLNPDTNFSESAKNAFRSACKDDLHEINRIQNEQRSCLKDYLYQQAGDRAIRKIGIIDSGWSCTIQDAIRGAMNEVEVISGVYLGVSFEGHRPSSQNRKYGLLRDDFRRLRHHNPVEMSAGVVRVWDTLLREPIETALKLERRPDTRVEPLFDKTGAIGNLERRAANSIREGIKQGTTARRSGVALLVDLCRHLSDTDMESAATSMARKISTTPSRKDAKAIMRLSFDEGSAEGRKSSLGMSSLREGISWYPGILSSFGLRWAIPLLESLIRGYLHIRKGGTKRSPNRRP